MADLKAFAEQLVNLGRVADVAEKQRGLAVEKVVKT